MLKLDFRPTKKIFERKSVIQATQIYWKISAKYESKTSQIVNEDRTHDRQNHDQQISQDGS